MNHEYDDPKHHPIKLHWGQFAVMALLTTAVAFGTLWMGYEQMRANSGFFVPLPTNEATPSARSF